MEETEANLLFSLPLIVAMLLFITNLVKKRNLFCISSVILGWYVFCFTLGCIIQFFYSHCYLVNMEAMLFLSGMLFFYFLPFIWLKDNKITEIVHPDEKKLNILIAVCIITGLFALIFYLPYFGKIFSGDIDANRKAMVLDSVFLVEKSFGHTIAVICSSFFHLSLFLTFYCYAFRKRSKLIILLLAISSFSEPLRVATQYGRDGFVSWIVIFFICWLFFYKFLDAKKKVTLMWLGLSTSFIMTFGFFLITLSRFQGRVFYKIVTYLSPGVRYFNFHYLLSDFLPKYDGQLTLPLLYKITNALTITDLPPQPEVRREIIMAGYEEFGMHSGQFGTFLGDFLYDFDNFTIVMISLFVCLGVKSALKIKGGKISFSQLINLLLYCYFMTLGVFYFRLGLSPRGNFLIISTLFFAWFMKGKQRRWVRWMGFKKQF